MELTELRTRDPAMIRRLTEVWEASVRATHQFLTEAEIQRIGGYVPLALCGVAHLVVAERTPGQPVAFLGAEGDRLEMLFLAPAERGAGLGRRLVEHAIAAYGVRTVTVNEQNPQAVGFYEHLGFRTVRRTDRDEEGGPYPLLYMSRPG